MSQFDQADAGIDVEDAAEQPPHVSWNLAEIVAVALVLILVILLVASVIGALTTPGLFQSVADSGPSEVGNVLERAGAWASPQSAAIFLLGSLALAWWQIESWTNDDNDPYDAEAFVHLRRAAIVTRIDLVLSFLVVAGGVLIVVGTSLLVAPGDDWSDFVVNVGIALGSLVLGVVGMVAARRLLSSGKAAAATWHETPTAL